MNHADHHDGSDSGRVTGGGALGTSDTEADDSLSVIGLLTLDGLLLGAFGLAFTPLYVGVVPVPMGAVLSILILPWLVLRAGEIDPRPGFAGAPLIAWFLAVMVLGLTGPGGDVILPTQPSTIWTSLLLVFGGGGVGLWALRRVLNGEVADHA